MRNRDEWKNFGYALERAEKAVRDIEYRGMFEAPKPSLLEHLGFRDLPTGALAVGQVDQIVSAAALAPPHGLDLLLPSPAPSMPPLPLMPERKQMQSHDAWKLDRYEKLVARIQSLREDIEEKITREQHLGSELATACREGNLDAIRQLMITTLRRHPLPAALALEADFALDTESRVALCTIQVPDLAHLAIVGKRSSSWNAQWLDVSNKVRSRSADYILFGLCVRAAYLVAMADPVDFFDIVSVNAHQKWFDSATGVPREGIIASLQATKNELHQLQPGHFDSKACFRHLSGISTHNILDAAPVRPIFVMDTNDRRIVSNRDVVACLEEETNLAAMPWEDFEHLVRQIFEWLFAKEGVEVKVTRASRDRGVDAILFDPDPIRGGKYVVQAKRYTRTVDVAAVRDLYGTVVNEGANRGILVTTSSYGPDAYEFAKDKPISLIDGPNLLALLRKHGRHYRIDLDEARRLERANLFGC